MRLLTAVLMLGALAWAQQAPQTGQKTSRASGQVVDQRGEPVRGATVKLFGKSVYTQTTDDKGAFSFDTVESGTYALAAQRNGYAAQKYGATTPFVRDCPNGDALTGNLNPIQLANLQQCAVRAPGALLSLAGGQETKELTITLLQLGSISGRLINQDGDPVQRWQVQAMKVTYVRGKRQLQAGFGAATDANGNFSATNLTPGRYYLRALNATANSFAGLSLERQPKPTPEADVMTYYPSVGDEASAVAID